MQTVKSKPLSLIKVAAGALAFVLSSGIGVSVNAQTKTITIYSGRSEKLISPLLEKAEKDLGMNIQVRYGDTAELAIALVEEGKNSRADLYFAQDAGALGLLERRNITLPISSNLVNQVDSRFRSPQGKWLGISGRARVLNYNTNLVQKNNLPNSVWDLVKPQWRGKIAWAPTNGSFQSFVTAMRVTEGEPRTLQWLKAMKANGVKDYRNNTAIVEALGRGESHIGLVNHYYLGRFQKENPNFPVAPHYTNKDAASMINIAGVAIMNSTKQKAEVEKLISYLLRPSSQTYFAQETNEYPVISGVAGPANQVPLNQIKTPNVNLTNLNDLPGTLELLQQAGVL
ncbi:iron ABC transporter substrate-binding protein [Nodularia harveyana UHCC-0300]|uniref:Iron ABC transporter substrate-binding protein n=1 Tax=Nodularia harveyana UHCC-0300 TaxID=2974287 RepID=A0ABU5UFZ7_9CYAN|nr:iron ABC transporter substrate-binding protein [Nodularia harveyana]MEA5582464.1 iron ABC transporter substrate-binding protein [Nodularia harveyana UHCC-0300]